MKTEYASMKKSLKGEKATVSRRGEEGAAV